MQLRNVHKDEAVGAIERPQAFRLLSGEADPKDASPTASIIFSASIAACGRPTLMDEMTVSTLAKFDICKTIAGGHAATSLPPALI